ncbi:MAG TPA: hypothetical protein VL380_00715, partial [Nitrosospira sp.]|nr:hypothetical protein [Nitrosospira sp.]
VKFWLNIEILVKRNGIEGQFKGLGRPADKGRSSLCEIQSNRLAPAAKGHLGPHRQNHQQSRYGFKRRVPEVNLRNELASNIYWVIYPR